MPLLRAVLLQAAGSARPTRRQLFAAPLATHLLQAIDNFRPTHRLLEKPLRMPLTDVLRRWEGLLAGGCCGRYTGGWCTAVCQFTCPHAKLLSACLHTVLCAL